MKKSVLLLLLSMMLLLSACVQNSSVGKAILRTQSPCIIDEDSSGEKEESVAFTDSLRVPSRVVKENYSLFDTCASRHVLVEGMCVAQKHVTSTVLCDDYIPGSVCKTSGSSAYCGPCINDTECSLEKPLCEMGACTNPQQPFQQSTCLDSNEDMYIASSAVVNKVAYASFLKQNELRAESITPLSDEFLFTDFCSSLFTKKNYHCSLHFDQEKSILHIVGTYLSLEDVQCPQEKPYCSKGACVTELPSQEPCVDDDATFTPSFVETQILETSSFGLKKSVKGYNVLSGKYGKQTDACFDDTTLLEFYCYNKTHYDWDMFTCQKNSFCVDGACSVRQQDQECTDPDTSYTPNRMAVIKGDVYAQDMLYNSLFTKTVTRGYLGNIFTSAEDICYNATAVREAYCWDARTIAQQDVFTCEQGFICFEGACMLEEQKNQFLLKQENMLTAPLCTDTESSPDVLFETKGVVSLHASSGQVEEMEDTCLTETLLLERFCVSPTEAGYEAMTCESGTVCTDGRCVPSPEIQEQKTAFGKENLQKTETPVGKKQIKQTDAWQQAQQISLPLKSAAIVEQPLPSKSENHEQTRVAVILYRSLLAVSVIIAIGIFLFISLLLLRFKKKKREKIHSPFLGEK